MKDLTSIFSALTYFHCLQVIEELKSTEGEAKNIFGQYTSPRLKVGHTEYCFTSQIKLIAGFWIELY